MGFGEEYTRVAGFSNRDAGAIVLKGTSLNPRLGNAAHRVAETPAGMLNAIGLQGPGVDGFIKKYWPFLKSLQVPTIINIWGTTVEEYAEVARRFDALEFILAGASAIGVGTALFYDPMVCRKINAGIVEYLERHKLERVSDLVGGLEIPQPATNSACG